MLSADNQICEAEVDAVDSLALFCPRQVRRRSHENQMAFRLLMQTELVGPVVGLLRQELDSMIRVIYLLSIKDMVYRADLIEASVNGKRWKGPDGKSISDRMMVNKTQSLHRWAQSVYSFGCGFIHLSRNHDYLAIDPFKSISTATLSRKGTSASGRGRRRCSTLCWAVST